MKPEIKDPKTLIDKMKAKTNPHQSPTDIVLSKVMDGLEETDIKELINKSVGVKLKKIQVLEGELTETNSDDEKQSIQGQIDLLKGEIDKAKVYQYQLLVRCVELVIEKVDQLGYGICQHQDRIYLFNGSYWELTVRGVIKNFLGVAAEKLGVERDRARWYLFKEKLYEQLRSGVTQMVPTVNDMVSINLQNGTYDITRTKRALRPFNKRDFIRYQLPFVFESKATSPMFHAFLDKVLPDPQCQRILAEYIGYIFIKGHVLKLEKVLLLFGTGSNGKSVVFDVVKAIVGGENMSHYSLQSLCDQAGYNRAELANKLVNYSSELNGDLSADKFKQLASGEPIEARHLYSSPFILKDYGKLLFNCNELPYRVEHTHGFFRRFLILPFAVKIPDEEQDKGLADKIIKDELSGVFNWAMHGLERLLKQQGFTNSDVTKEVLSQFKLESDTVQLFLDENQYKPSADKHDSMRIIYDGYRGFCALDGYQAVNMKNFRKRVETLGYTIHRKNTGMVIFLSKSPK